MNAVNHQYSLFVAHPLMENDFLKQVLIAVVNPMLFCLFVIFLFYVVNIEMVNNTSLKKQIHSVRTNGAQ